MGIGNTQLRVKRIVLIESEEEQVRAGQDKQRDSVARTRRKIMEMHETACN